MNIAPSLCSRGRYFSGGLPSTPLLPLPSFSFLCSLTSSAIVFAGLTWLDAFLNAAIILSGMCQVSPLHNQAGKLFVTFYAL